MKQSHLRTTGFSPIVRFICACSLTSMLVIAGCSKGKVNQVSSADSGAYPPTSKSDCLPGLTLTDQFGKPVLLSSLKGRPILFDFIYTHCPGPCLLLTSQMRSIADKLGSDLGKKVLFVSVTVDPEHDGAKELLEYAKQQGADRDGWIFLTGPPTTIDSLMANFNLYREHNNDGTIGHVLEFFLVDPTGHQIAQYSPHEAKATALAADALRASGLN